MRVPSSTGNFNVSESGSPRRGDNRALSASLIWIIGGFVFPFLTPATAFLSEGLQRYLSSMAGMPDELAFRVAFTLIRIPLTAALAMLVATAQCAVMRGVRPLARRWIIASAVGACVSTLIFLPSTLVALQIAGDTSGGLVRTFLLVVPGAGLLGGFVSFLQARATRAEVFIPGWFVAANVLSAALGVFVELRLE
jgi:hypothetical protein